MFILISLGLVAVAALIILIGALIGLIRGLKKTIASFVAIVISFVAALAAALIACSPELGILAGVVDAIKGYIPLDVLGEITEVVPIDSLLVYYVSMFLAPIVFFAVFLVALVLLSIIAMIVVKFIAKQKDFSKVTKRLGGLGLGALCGILISMLVLMPVVGLLDIGAKVGETEKLSPELVGPEISALLDEASDDVALKFMNIYCGWIYDGLASANFKGETVSLEDDAVALICVLTEIENFASGDDGFGQKQVDALNTIIDSIDKSPILRDTLASLLSEMATTWLEGGEFMGISKMEGGELLDPIIDKILGVIAESNKDNISADMKTLTGILGLFVKHDMFANSGDYKALLKTMGGEGVITELISVSNANPRMSFISDDITKLSVKALASTIGIPEDEDERYDLLMNEIADALNSSKDMAYEERLVAVEADVAEALLDYGVEVEGQASLDIAGSIIEDLGQKDKVSATDVSEFFIMYSVADTNADSVNADNGSDYELLSETDSFTFKINPDGTISVNGRVLKNYNLDNYAESGAYKLGKNHTDIGGAASLYSAKSMRSSLVTLADILKNVKMYSECSDPDAAAEKMSEMLVFAAESFDTDGGLTSSQLVKNMGELLDMMHECELFGNQATSDMVKAIFQSKDVRDEMGLSFSEIGTFTDKLNETAREDDSSYTSTTQSISQTLEVVDKINDKNTDKEERREATEQLMSNMTPSNAELLSTMTTPSMMIKYGAKEEKALTVSDSVSVLFRNMADFAEYSEHGEGSEEYAREANAVNTVLMLVMDSTDSEEEYLFAKDGSEGKTGVSADEYVELLVTSEVVSSTLLSTVEKNSDDPFGITATPEDEEMLTVAMENYYMANKTDGDNTDLVSKLEAIAIVTNIPVPEFN